MKLYLRNVKKGFATNSSSYHSTMTHYIDIPMEIWVEFKESDKIPNKKGDGYFYSSGLNLIDDEQYIWTSLAQLENVGFEVQALGPDKVRIILETNEDDREGLKQLY